MQRQERRESSNLEVRKSTRSLLSRAFSAIVLASLFASPAQAADMQHRLREHVVETYLIGSLGASLTGHQGETVPGLLNAQLGAGVVFPGTGLGVWGFELAVGPGLPLSEHARADTYLMPGFIFEIPISNLQLFARFSGILPSTQDDAGLALAFLAGWYARPMSWRVGLVYDIFADGRAFTGLRFEMLWLGHDPIPGR